MPFKNETEDAGYEGHESIIILNSNNKDAEVLMDIYFEEKEPIESVKIIVPAKE